jgi:hypothetical protein
MLQTRDEASTWGSTPCIHYADRSREQPACLFHMDRLLGRRNEKPKFCHTSRVIRKQPIKIRDEVEIDNMLGWVVSSMAEVVYRIGRRSLAKQCPTDDLDDMNTHETRDVRRNHLLPRDFIASGKYLHPGVNQSHIHGDFSWIPCE